MASLVVRRLDETVKDRLKERAKSRGHSLEAEVREILEEAAGKQTDAEEPDNAIPEKGFGTLMHERASRVGLTKRERQRFEDGIREFNANSRMRIPNFDP